ncbi:MAG: hypothetical protein WC834_04725 [Eubacteriales bacterium]|nr:MAG: hypothetical protein CVV03_05030 [Firmicutes bacterium HGW-Firmicutes-8]
MRLRITMVSLVLIFSLLIPLAAYAEQKWEGTDDLVDRKMEEVSGVFAKEPLIDISEGNLGLFLFAAGGFTAGTIFGYQWRKLFGEKVSSEDDQRILPDGGCNCPKG